LMDLRVASHPTLKRIYSVYEGWTSDVVPTQTTTTPPITDAATTTTASTGKDTLVQWGDWNDMYFIIVVAAGGAAVLGCFLVLLICCYCLRRQRKREQAFMRIQHTKSTSTELISPTFSDKTTPKNSNSTNSSVLKNNKGGGLPFPAAVDRQPSTTSETVDAIIEQQSSTTNRSADAVMNGRMENHENDDDDLESSLSNGSHDRSEVASIYSYIDSKSILSEDDHCYSVGGALMYNPHIPGDDQSTNWSIANGNMNGVGGANLTSDNNNMSHLLQEPISPSTPEKSDNSAGSLDRVVATAASSPEGENIMIFCDGATDDDTLSMISDSMLATTLDYSNDNYGRAQSHVAVAVANLEARAAGSTPKSSRAAFGHEGIERNNISIVGFAVSDANKPDASLQAASSASEVGGGEVDQSFADSSVSLTAYMEAPYANERVSNQTHSEKLINGSIASSDSGAQMPPQESTSMRPSTVRSRTTSRSGESATSIGNNGTESDSLHSGRSSSPPRAPQASFVLRSSSFKSWAVPVSKSSTDEDSSKVETKASRTQLQANSTKGGRFAIKSSRISKASQLVLNSVSSPSGSQKENQTAPMVTQSTALSNYPLQSLLPTVDQYQESESDIQSICSNDDHSLFSFAKSENGPLSRQAARGSTALTEQERSLLGAHRPVTPPNDDDDKDYIRLPAAYS
jgi:hypothetical protein